MSRVAGRALVDGRPCADERVLVVSGDMARLLAVTSTGAGGEFELELAEDGAAVLLLKVTEDVVTVVHERIDLAAADALEVAVDTSAGFVTLAGAVESDSGRPERLDVYLDPVRIEGVPDELEPFFKQHDHGVFDGRFVKRTIASREFAFRVRPGSYRIGAEYLNYDRPMMSAPSFENYLAARATSDGADLAGNEYVGFLVDVDRDRRVVLSLRVVQDEELVG